jgi:hypothetical protein
VTLLFLTGLFEKLPEATLAAVVIAAVLELVDIATLRRLARVVVRGQSPASGRGPISSRPSPRCSGFSSSTRSPASSSVSPARSSCSCIARRGRG